MALALLAMRFVNPPTTALHTQRRIESLIEGNWEYQKRFSPVRADKISPHLGHAVVASEDGRYYEHPGIDMEAIRKALEDNEKRNRPRGGSTITQQLVKNLFLTTHSTVWRKAIELPAAYMADFLLPKDRILLLYLNVIEWGPGIYGAEAAAMHHYGRSASRLTRSQSARLAACIPAPRTRSPQKMNRLGGTILRRMGQHGW